MRFSQLSAIALSFQFSLARPTSSSRRSLIPLSDTTEAGRPRVVQLQQVHTGSVKSASKSEAEEEEKENEVEIAGTLNTPVALKGGDLKQDVVYVASVGDFEVEYQAKTTRTLTVSENKSPAAAPAGFKALEPSSFKVNFTEGGADLTLGQIDYIFDATKEALKGVDLSKSRVGKLCTETNTFVIDDALGETEFEVEENEIVLKVKDLSGEFGIFVPQAAGENANGGAKKGGGAAKEGDDAAKEGDGAAGEKDEKAGQIEVTGMFGSLNRVGANVFTNLNFAANAAGFFEVEYNSTVANTILVAPKLASVAPPAGHLFVDPLTFTIRTEKPPQASDTLKVDYIFTSAMKAAIDASKGVVGKFDAATQQFVTTGLGEFEFEAEEDEWTLTVTDLNGEWAFFVPESAVL